MPTLPCILLVDDDPTTNFLNQHLLRRLDAADRVLVAADGADALTQLVDHCTPPTPNCPALILLDVNMPGLNGIQFLEAYRHLPLATAPVRPVLVMLSTSLHPRDVARVEALGLVAEFLVKPLTADKLRGVLGRHFGMEAGG